MQANGEQLMGIDHQRIRTSTHQRHISKMRIFFILIFIALCQTKAAQAEWMPGFNLNYSLDQSEMIVVGNLEANGSLQITEVIRQSTEQKIEKSERISLFSGAAFHRDFNRLLPNTSQIEIVAFLKEKHYDAWHPVWGVAGIVALTPNTIYHYREGPQGGNFLSGASEGNAFHGKSSFLETVRRAEILSKEQQKLSEKPRSPNRVTQLLDFLLIHTLSPDFPFGISRPFWDIHPDFALTPGVNFGKIVQALKQPSPAEAEILIAALNRAEKPAHQVALLQVMQYIALDPQHFDQLARFSDPAFSSEVRASAIRALAATNHYRATEFLTKYLHWSDPELLVVLRTLSSNDYTQNQRLSLKAVDALEILARTVPTEKIHSQLASESYGLIHLLTHSHPRLIAALYHWAFTINEGKSGQAMSDLRSLSGLSSDSHPKEALENWWHTARPVLMAAYNLSNETGREAWFLAYQKADTATQKLLLRLWFFEPEIDVDALLRATDKAYADAPKAVLAEMWRLQQLPPKAKQAIVAKFASVRLIQDTPLTSGRIRLQIIGESRFPFPQNSAVEYGSEIVFDGQTAALNGKSLGNSGSLKDWGSGFLGALGTGDRGQSTANAVFGVREFDFRSKKVLWQHQWRLGSLPLKRLEPEK